MRITELRDSFCNQKCQTSAYAFEAILTLKNKYWNAFYHKAPLISALI